MLAVAVVTAPELVLGVVLAGIGALLGVVIGIGLMIYAQGGNVVATYQNMKQLPSTETSDQNTTDKRSQ